MTTPNLFDVVMLKTDLLDSHLVKGETGTVIECYTDGECEIVLCHLNKWAKRVVL
jgi:hypothetical protein